MIFSDLSPLSSFSLRVVTFAFHSSLSLCPPPTLGCLSGGGAVTSGDPLAAHVQLAPLALAPDPHTHVHSTQPCERLSACGTLLSLPLDRRAMLSQVNPHTHVLVYKVHYESPTFMLSVRVG